jgi:hypothetical protein
VEEHPALRQAVTLFRVFQTLVLFLANFDVDVLHASWFATDGVNFG